MQGGQIILCSLEDRLISFKDIMMRDMIPYSCHGPSVSVVIPCHNSGIYLAEAIESVLSQTRRDFEVIVVDDGSTDCTPKIVAQYRTRIRYFRQENKGLSSARNLGIQLSRGEYLVFLDADDLLLPNKLELQASYLDQHPEVDVVYSDGYRMLARTNGSERQTLYSRSGYLDQDLSDTVKCIESLAIKNAFPVHAATARANSIRAAGGFDETLVALEDWDLWFRVAQKHRFSYLDAIITMYRVNEKSMSKNAARMIKACRQMEEKRENCDVFMNLISPIKSKFYYELGKIGLKFGEWKFAAAKFERAVNINKLNFHAYLGYLMALTFGCRIASLLAKQGEK